MSADEWQHDGAAVDRRPRHWITSLLRTRTLAGALAVITLISVIASYIFVTRHADPTLEARSIIPLILVNLVLLLILCGMVTRRAVRLWASWRKGSVGSRLQTRIVVTFTLVTIIPTIIVSVASALFFNLGIQSWFDDRVSTALEDSVAVAQAYLSEHKDILRGDAIAMSYDLDHEIDAGALGNYLYTGVIDKKFSDIIDIQARRRSLSEAIVFQHGKILAQTSLSFATAFEPLPATEDVVKRAAGGEVVVMLEDKDKVRAVVKLASLPDTYLLIGRFIDGKVVAHVDTAEGSVQKYRNLKANISSLQIKFFIVFVLVALILLFAAVWYGMFFASRLVVPVTKLVNAAERVRAGDYAVRVAEGPLDDEVGTLARAFNRMTDELERRRMDLIEANRQLDTRRRFSEAVLSGVSAGVIALSRDKRISLANPVAGHLLLLPPDMALKGKSIAELVPEFEPLFLLAEEKIGQLAQGDVTITRTDKSHVLHVRVTAERIMEAIEGYIVTFDDITELLIAQRSAAWSDVARRVAHEIKNPLTPIQLAAERLKKKYLPQITVDADAYLRYIDTISRHVGDIGKIVEEFVTFARMPTPIMRREDITSIMKKSLFSEQTSHADIAYQLDLDEEPVYIICDEQQISRVLLNLLKNSGEAFEGKDGMKQITMTGARDARHYRIRITDNGPGFPADKMHRLLEPYVTTRAKGTGLGLAIVKKIVDDHKAVLSLENHIQGGACVTLSFSIDSDKNVT